MENFFAILSMINQLLPAVVQTVSVVETAFPQGGQGAAKLEATKNILQTAYQQEQVVVAPFEQAWPAMNAIANATVSIFNAAKKAV